MTAAEAGPAAPHERFGLQLERTLRYFQSELAGDGWRDLSGDVWTLASTVEIALRERQTQPAGLDALVSARDLLLRRGPQAIDGELLALAVQAAWSPQRGGLRPERAAAVLDLAAAVYHWRGMLAEAEACCRAALDLADASGDPELRACARGEFGRFLLLHDRIPEGLAQVKAALALARACGSERAQVRALLVLGWHYNRLQDGRRARRRLRRALALAEALGEPNYIGRAWLDLSVAYRHLKDFDRAEKTARRALAYFKRSGDLRLQAQTWQCLGILHFGGERYQQAARHFLHTRQVYERLGDPHDLAAVYANLGAAYWGLQDWPRAEAYSRRALDLARRLGLEDMEINLLVNFGWIYVEQPKHAEAAAALREARAQLEARAGRAELADWVRLKLGEVAELEARLPAAPDETTDEHR